MGTGRRIAAGACSLALAGGMAAPAAASDHDWKVVANVGLAGVALAAAGTSAYEQDWPGAEQLALSAGVTEAATWGLKHGFPEERPNHRDRRSFPSGHTSLSFAAAGYLQERYGWEIGLPATAVATLVGVARVKSHDHHWYDVAAGAALGELTAHLITQPHDGNVRFLPWADSHGAGFALAARF